MPAISLFGLDGNHFGIWLPPVINTYKHICKHAKILSHVTNHYPNTKIFSTFDIKGIGLTNA